MDIEDVKLNNNNNMYDDYGNFINNNVTTDSNFKGGKIGTFAK